MACCCFGVISRFSQTKPLRVYSRCAHFGGVEIGQRAGQQLDRLVLVHQAPRLAEQRGALTSVARITPLRSRMSGRAVAIASCGGAARAVALGGDGEHHQLAGR